jgi:DNA-directed RNA polymerase subunit beta
METKHFGRFQSILDVPSLTDIQTKSYEDFLQVDVPFNRRLEHRPGVHPARDVPDLSYDKTMSLQYVGYELGSRATRPMSAASSR